MPSSRLPSIFAAAFVLAGIWFAARHAAADDAADAAASPRVHPARLAQQQPALAGTLKVGSNELLVLAVPTPVTPDAPLVETQRCYVWRDLEFRTASLNCVTSGDEALPLAPPPPSYER